MKRHSKFRVLLTNLRKRWPAIVITGTLVLVVGGLLTTVYFANALSSKESIMNRNKTGVTLLDRNDKVFYEFDGAQENTYVPLANISDIAQKAAISSEDKNFYNHPGFSVTGIAQAVYENLRPGGLDSGGSTITQQLVRSALLTQDRNIFRKYFEIVLSVEIERRYSKQEILEMYLNSVYFGEGAFGIEDAAKLYFNKQAKDLTLAEASLLIGIIPAPSTYSPITGNAELAEKRQTYVLNRMKDDKVINAEQAADADKAPLAYAPKSETRDAKAPHFALMVKEELIEKYGAERIARSGYKVKTTLDLDWQAKAESALVERLNRLQYDTQINGSVVITDPKTGGIVALVGSRDWYNEQYGKVNMATSPRQPGSSFKPIMYATGIEEGTLTAATILNDEPTDFGGYKPENFDFRYRGDVTVRRALANSLNIPAVQALELVGITDTIQQAKKMGISTIDHDAGYYGLSLTLGTASVRLTELTNVYASFANSGKQFERMIIESIENKDGNEIFKAKPSPRQVISAQTSFIMSDILSDNNARAESFGSNLTVAWDRRVAVKTGTTEDYRDALTVGFTPSLAIGIWMGNNDNTPISVGSSIGPAPVWRQLMQELLTGTPVEHFEQPVGVVAASICRSNGGVAERSGGNTYTEYFRSGKLPTEKCNTFDEEREARDRGRDRRNEDDEDEERRRLEEEERERQQEEEQQQEETPEDEEDTEQTPPIIPEFPEDEN